jgi:hypothetical protein
MREDNPVAHLLRGPEGAAKLTGPLGRSRGGVSLRQAVDWSATSPVLQPLDAQLASWSVRLREDDADHETKTGAERELVRNNRLSRCPAS